MGRTQQTRERMSAWSFPAKGRPISPSQRHYVKYIDCIKSFCLIYAPVPSLNYNHLRYFWVIAHETSLTRAAERLNLSQSALSVQFIKVGALTTLSRNFQLQFLRPLVGRADVQLIVRSGTMRDLLAQLEAHAVDVVLANSAAKRDAQLPFRNHLLNQQPVSLVGRPRPDARPFRFPDDLRSEPVLLPSLDSEIRVAFDRVLELAGIRPTVLAEVDDMAMLRLLARELDGVTLVPSIVVRDELEAGVLIEHCRIPGVTESFYAIVQNRRFPNLLLGELLMGATTL
jgi:LysR family transcriptional activator of nhaA